MIIIHYILEENVVIVVYKLLVQKKILKSYVKHGKQMINKLFRCIKKENLLNLRIMKEKLTIYNSLFTIYTDF